MKKKEIVVSVGVHDVFSGVLAERAGFKTLFVGGFGASASLLGLPDLGLITQTEMADFIRRLVQRVSIPVIADGDTGHGGLSHVFETVRLFEEAGAAGILIEDQENPKRCGHFQGKTVVSDEDAVARVIAAKNAIQNKNFLLIGRTDARDLFGVDKAIQRANLFLKAGADMVFVESPASREELKKIGAQTQGPLLANMLTGGKTPTISVQEAERWGYRVAVYPIESLLATAKSLSGLFRDIVQKKKIKPDRKDMIRFSEVKKLLHEKTRR